MPLADNLDKVIFSQQFPPDKIVEVFEGSFTANASSSLGIPERTHHTISHDFGQTVFLQMIYSRDGGATWQDQHVGVPDLTIPSAPVFQTVDVGCYSTSTQVVIVASNFTTSNKTIQYLVAAMWKD